jgi:hypothetical protein
MNETQTEIIKPELVKVPNGTAEVVETVSTILYGAFMLVASVKALWPQIKKTLDHR